MGGWDEGLSRMELLTRLLQRIDSNPRLSGRIALHGGTAINAYLLDLPRLSVDIDLSYLGNIDSVSMGRERAEVLDAVRRSGESMGLSASYGKDGHAGRTVRFKGDGVGVKADVNFMNRVVPHDPVRLESHVIPGTTFTVLSPYDLYGGKIRALLGRTAIRDLYDISMLGRSWDGMPWDKDEMHASLLLYATLSDLFPQQYVDSFSDGLAERFASALGEVNQSLVPFIRSTDAADGKQLLSTVVNFVIQHVDPQTEGERRYVDGMRHGLFVPELIMPEDVAERAHRFPEAMWKERNLKRYAELPVTPNLGPPSAKEVTMAAKRAASSQEGDASKKPGHGPRV